MTELSEGPPEGGGDHDHDHDHGHGHEGERAAGAETHLSLSVPEMDCPSCAGKVTASVGELDGIEDMDPQPTTGTLLVRYDPDVTGPREIIGRVEAAGYAVETPADAHVETLSVPEMDCPSCAGKVGSALDGVEGLLDYDLQPTTGSATVTFDPDLTDRETVIAAVERAGYPVTNAEAVEAGEKTAEVTSPASVWSSRRALKTWVSGAFLALGLGVEFLATGANVPILALGGRELLLAELLLLVGIAAGGQVIVRNGYYSARNLNLDIDFLMAAAVLSATGVSLVVPGVSLYVEAASLAFLFNISELLERYSVDRARNSLAELLSLSPDTARVRRDGEEMEVPVSEVTEGERVLVQPGEKIPMDGVVLEGESAVNEASITGESMPIDKTPGDDVYAGTINEQGYLELETTGTADENTISRIIELVEDAQANKTEREQFVDRFSGYYTPVIVAFAVLTAAVPPLLLGAPWETWFVRGIALLVIACPCAFVISTPVTVVSGITSAAKNGVLIKGGNHLEAMGEVDVVAFDKTGTLTKGELAVTDVIPLGDNTEADVLRCARGLETRSEHPIGDAIVERADAQDVDAREGTDFESITGKGVRADLDGITHFAGKPGFFEELGFDLGHVHFTGDAGAVSAETRDLCERQGCLDLVDDTLPRLQAAGKTVVLVGTDEELEGIIAVADDVRPDATFAVSRLRELGVKKLVMLTGDNEGTARAVAEEVGVDDYRAELLPEQKVDAVEDLVEEYGDVAMVGDGINDAPALATATVGVAMGAAGTDTALETADIALMADDLSKLPYLYELSNRGNGVIRQNIWGSLAVKALLAIGIPFGYVSVVVAILAGDVGMTTLVTGNAMRLSRITPEDFF